MDLLSHLYDLGVNLTKFKYSKSNVIVIFKTIIIYSIANIILIIKTLF